MMAAGANANPELRPSPAMTSPDPAPLDDRDSPRWHKRFGSHCNNRGWKLSVQPARTPAEDREMLDVAHAAAWHWDQVGTALNRMRAQMLLAEVHALLGFGASALAIAEEMRAYFLQRDCDAWELTLTHAIHAHAAHVAGRASLHRQSHAEALSAFAAIDNAADRAIVDKTLSHIPRP